MGVSLERVQFKFASIIGELCSEPDVLSQFAVWLDLRLAEYKLKGNISLDCLGEEPDPSWLQGLSIRKKMLLKSRTSSDNVRSQISNNNPFYPLENTDIMSRLSPDLTSKPETDNYPYGINPNQREKIGRKRSVLNPGSSKKWPSSPKQPRLSSQVDSPSNQSLMSVLGGLQENSQEEGSKDDNVEIIPVSTTSPTDQPIPGTSTSEINPELNSSILSSLNESESSYAENGGGTESMKDLKTDQDPALWQSMTLSRSAGSVERRKFILNLHQLPRQTVINMVSAAGTFERWLREKLRDCRRIIQIAPAELDELLAEFFLRVKRPCGDDYKLQSLQTLRSHLDRYLKECGYPESLKSSRTFSKSNEAFQKRRQELYVKATMCNVTRYMCMQTSSQPEMSGFSNEASQLAEQSFTATGKGSRQVADNVSEAADIIPGEANLSIDATYSLTSGAVQSTMATESFQNEADQSTYSIPSEASRPTEATCSVSNETHQFAKAKDSVPSKPNQFDQPTGEVVLHSENEDDTNSQHEFMNPLSNVKVEKFT